MYVEFFMEKFYLDNYEFYVHKSSSDRYYLSNPNNKIRPEVLVGIPKQYIMEFANLIEVQTCKNIPTFSNREDFHFYTSCLQGLYNFKGFKILSNEEKQNYIFNLITYHQNEKYISENLTLSGSFMWETTPQRADYWIKINKKIIKYENQLQNKNIDRSRNDRSEGDQLCCRGDESESSARHCSYQARARKRKNAFGSHKVYLSSRCGCVHRG